MRYFSQEDIGTWTLRGEDLSAIRGIWAGHTGCEPAQGLLHVLNNMNQKIWWHGR